MVNIQKHVCLLNCKNSNSGLTLFLHNKQCFIFFKTGCGCHSKGIEDVTECDQDTGKCFCDDGWYGDKCFVGKFFIK